MCRIFWERLVDDLLSRPGAGPIDARGSSWFDGASLLRTRSERRDTSKTSEIEASPTPIRTTLSASDALSLVGIAEPDLPLLETIGVPLLRIGRHVHGPGIDGLHGAFGFGLGLLPGVRALMLPRVVAEGPWARDGRREAGDAAEFTRRVGIVWGGVRANHRRRGRGG